MQDNKLLKGEGNCCIEEGPSFQGGNNQPSELLDFCGDPEMLSPPKPRSWAGSKRTDLLSALSIPPQGMLSSQAKPRVLAKVDLEVEELNATALIVNLVFVLPILSLQAAIGEGTMEIQPYTWSDI